ncbi:hypothetical protein KEM48_000238 [Puccinia striiformis f. sp. tritici PST-130]|nr:hypothetical protein KEM48_000238 [Puccinia striiformis f. sp. tritici PST-130]
MDRNDRENRTKSPSEAADDLIPCRSVRESADAYTSRRDPIRCQNGLPVSQTNSTSPHVLKALLSSANRSANEQGLTQRSQAFGSLTNRFAKKLANVCESLKVFCNRSRNLIPCSQSPMTGA